MFLYDENLHGPGKELEDVFEAGILCSSKSMYPDWLSLTGEGYVAEIYKKYGAIISPMGCRAFLSPWFERGGMEPADAEDKPVFRRAVQYRRGQPASAYDFMPRQSRKADPSSRFWIIIWS